MNKTLYINARELLNAVDLYLHYERLPDDDLFNTMYEYCRKISTGDNNLVYHTITIWYNTVWEKCSDDDLTLGANTIKAITYCNNNISELGAIFTAMGYKII